MICGRGEGKTTPQELYLAKKNIHVDRILGIDVGGYNLFVKMCREYAFNWLMFEQAVQLHWNRTYAPTPVHLLRLKKPILPNRWINFREGWCSAAWGFTNADLTPYEIEEAVDKLLKEINNPYFKKKIDTLTMPEGFTFGEDV